MKMRMMSSSGPEVPVIGLGTMSWPGCHFGEANSDAGVIEAKSPTAMVEKALTLGISLIDTAEGYGQGLAEIKLGEAILDLSCRDQLTIVTKTGPLFGDEKSGGRGCNLSRDHILKRVDGCLTRLQVETVDILLAHWPDAETPIEETMSAIQELKDAGKILHFGVSNFSNDLLAEALKHGPIVCNQLPCSLADRSIEDGRREFCRSHNVGIMAYSPIGKGILSGKYSSESLPPSGDYRHSRPHFSDRLNTNLELARRVKALALEAGTSPVAVALAFTLSLPGITVAIPGAKSLEQLVDHAEAARLLDFPDVVAELDGLVSLLPE